MVTPPDAQTAVHDVQIAGAKVLPAVGGMVATDFTLNEMVALCTLLYIALQAAYLLWKWRREATRPDRGNDE
ncbi:hypothetical protein [Chitiniphilus eburneus]|uniref:hypothetical protein n=1 Tax=Chitiniphilus eburneus TaxID=2571148 RepID=UPI0035D1093A